MNTERAVCLTTVVVYFAGGGVRAMCPITSSQNSRARVWVRTRPTANFAHNMINLLPDGKVTRFTNAHNVLYQSKNEARFIFAITLSLIF